MAISDNFNPFRVLRLPTHASQAEIASQGEKLLQQAPGPEETAQIRQAVELLQTNQRTRLVYELFELPTTRYTDEAWAAFAQQQTQELPETHMLAQQLAAPTLEDLDLAALANIVLDSLTGVTAADLDVLLAATPYAPKYTLPLNEWDL